MAAPPIAAVARLNRVRPAIIQVISRSRGRAEAEDEGEDTEDDSAIG